MYKTKKEFRPNTKKIYEDFHGVKVPKGWAVHHTLPVRLGGTHGVSNLELLDRDCHVFAHLALYQEFGDIRDLCASYMLRGLTDEARKIASAAGGKAGWVSNREKGVVTGFGAQSEERRREVAAIAGKIGGTVQRDLGIGIHVDAETRAGWARLGAAAVAEQFADPEIQSSRGKRGGVKNKGSRWYVNGLEQLKYTAAQQSVESFEDFIARMGFRAGKFPAMGKGAKFYNDGTRQLMFMPEKNPNDSFEEFVDRNKYNVGRLK
jgi:hypothetical protein